MNVIEPTPLSLTLGLITVILVAFLRFYFPFRYQYLCLPFKRSPHWVKRILIRSYHRNRSAVGLLDRATKEILDGDYDKAETYILTGIEKVIKLRGLRNRLIRTLFYNHLSWILYYRGQHRESLEIAFRLYEKVPSTPNVLALILCNLARIGEVGQAIEIMTKLSGMRRVKPIILLGCEAEIEAAKGNLQKAVQLFDQAKGRKEHTSIYFNLPEIDKRINQLKKTA
ncbi:tetratricopeptide repeat protein [Ammoniphilus sp. 3BR4]|uniref:tetratricopeptide repeat protein n=1 Tax=Ammoniphilus sp. 3BR4 TaxID=3158265 RepID=UPI003467B7F2